MPWQRSGETSMLRPPGNLVMQWFKPGLAVTDSGLETMTWFLPFVHQLTGEGLLSSRTGVLQILQELPVSD